MPKSVTLTLTKLFSYNISNAVSLSYVKNMFISTHVNSATTGSPAGVYISHYLEVMDDQGTIVLARDRVGRTVTTAAGGNWIKLKFVSVSPAIFAGLGNNMTYKVRIKTVRESDNVESYSELWPCIYYVEPAHEAGA